MHSCNIQSRTHPRAIAHTHTHTHTRARARGSIGQFRFTDHIENIHLQTQNKRINISKLHTGDAQDDHKRNSDLLITV
jgi:hypothetical protein